MITQNNFDRKRSVKISNDLFDRNLCLSSAKWVEFDKFGESIDRNENVCDSGTTLWKESIIVGGDKVTGFFTDQGVHFS